MRVGSLHTMRRVNIGSFMNQVNESILLNQELNKSPFLRAIEADSIPELSAMIETETIEDFDFETQIKIADHQERIEQENMEQEMDSIIELEELEARNNSFKTWLFSNKLNSDFPEAQEIKPVLDTEYFRFVKKGGLSIEDLMTRIVASGWIYAEPSQIGINELLELIETNPINPDII